MSGKMDELIARLGKSTGPDRELDAEIAKALGLIPQSADDVRGDYETNNWCYSTPEYRAWDARQSEHFRAHGEFNENDEAPDVGPGYIRPYTSIAGRRADAGAGGVEPTHRRERQALVVG